MVDITTPSTFARSYTKAWLATYQAGVCKSSLDGTLVRFEDNLIVVFNAGRGVKRAAPPFSSVRDPFDPAKFSFLQVSEDQILGRISHQTMLAPSDEALLQHTLQDPDGEHVIFINIFPLSYYSGLLVPFLSEKRAQILSADALSVALKVARTLAGSPLWVTFNSQLAGASVNNLHFQFWLPERTLPVVTYPTHDTHMFSISDHHIAVSEPTNDEGVSFFSLPNTIASHDAVISLLAALVSVFLETGTPHNLIINSERVYVFPRQPMVVFDAGVQPGYCETAGQAYLPQREAFEAATGAGLRADIRRLVGLPHSTIDALRTAWVQRVARLTT